MKCSYLGCRCVGRQVAAPAGHTTSTLTDRQTYTLHYRISRPMSHNVFTVCQLTPNTAAGFSRRLSTSRQHQAAANVRKQTGTFSVTSWSRVVQMPTAAYPDKKFPVPGVSRTNPLYKLALCFDNRHFNIITLFTTSFLKWSFPLCVFHIRFAVCVYDLVGCPDSSVTIVLGYFDSCQDQSVHP